MKIIEKRNGLDPAAFSWGNLRRDFEVLGSDLAKLGEKSLNSGQEKLAEEAQRLKSLLADLAARTEARGRSSFNDLADGVSKRPIASIGLAFSLGLLVASLSGRRR